MCNLSSATNSSVALEVSYSLYPPPHPHSGSDICTPGGWMLLSWGIKAIKQCQ